MTRRMKRSPRAAPLMPAAHTMYGTAIITLRYAATMIFHVPPLCLILAPLPAEKLLAQRYICIFFFLSIEGRNAIFSISSPTSLPHHDACRACARAAIDISGDIPSFLLMASSPAHYWLRASLSRCLHAHEYGIQGHTLASRFIIRHDASAWHGKNVLRCPNFYLLRRMDNTALSGAIPEPLRKISLYDGRGQAQLASFTRLYHAHNGPTNA